MQTKRYCEAILKHKRNIDVEGDGVGRCMIAVFSGNNFKVRYEITFETVPSFWIHTITVYKGQRGFDTSVSQNVPLNLST